MLLSRLSVADFLRLPFGGPSEGGYAGLVFLVSRSADAPTLHSQFFQEWSDVHDLTGRYLAVIVPDPDGGIILDEERFHTQYGSLVPGVSLLSDAARLNRATHSRRAARMAPRAGARPDVEVAPERPHSVDRHRTALTRATSDLQEFFGISESLLPCLVVVSLLEQKTCAVALGPQASVYHFLKLVKIRLEPGIAQLQEAERALGEAKYARNALRARNPLTLISGKTHALTQQWVAQRAALAADLRGVADSGPGGELARLCTWMSDRITRDEPLTVDESTSAGELIRLLRAANQYGRLPRRTARTVAKLRAGYPATHDKFRELAIAQAQEEVVQRQVGAAKAELDRVTLALRLEPAVRSAAEEIGLAPAGTTGLLPGRALSWPISVLARPQHRSPSLRAARG